MVHYRINEKESNPNPHVNFITALPAYDDSEQESARQLLRALAAQVRPIMKNHGFVINSLEEYEYNQVFAGRNWNAGETVELVLRRADRTFCPNYWLMSTFCHELAHIKHMNHGPAFQALWRKLNNEVRALQDKGYYGDGYWSSGTRLADSAKVGGEGIEAGDLPEYVCGGAQSRARPSGARRRRARKPQEATASDSTGRQTAKRRKAGGRVTAKEAFKGTGAVLDQEAADTKGKGTGFGKQANSKRAREERALAAERRLLALKKQASSSSSSIKEEPKTEELSDEDSDDDVVEIVPETDDQRRAALLSSEKDDDLKGMKSGSLTDYFKDFNFPRSRDTKGEGGASAKKVSSSKSQPGLGDMVKAEIDLRKKESLGMAPVKGGGRTIGNGEGERKWDVKVPSPSEGGSKSRSSRNGVEWSCLICTLLNDPAYLACSACGTPRGEDSYRER